MHDVESRPSPPRRARRRRQNTPWLQRNALSVAAISVLVALLGLGFGLIQMINRPEPSPALLAVSPSEPSATAGTTLSAAAFGPSVQIGGTVPPGAVGGEPRPREIQASAKVMEPNYTIEAGDTLGRIAVRFNTTVERIQALNNLADPRTLRIGAKLVIPPPF
jgi:nucleoid-associated protein YgaU